MYGMIRSIHGLFMILFDEAQSLLLVLLDGLYSSLPYTSQESSPDRDHVTPYTSQQMHSTLHPTIQGTCRDITITVTE